MRGLQSILLADDDPIYARLLQSAVAKVAPGVPFFHVEDGEQATRFLGGLGQFSDRNRYPMPGLLLLDLEMPKMDGFQALEWIQERPDLRTLPVVVVSSSQDTASIARSHDLGAWAFFTKPKTAAGFQQLAFSLESCLDSVCAAQSAG
jgi:two-component system response regulator